MSVVHKIVEFDANLDCPPGPVALEGQTPIFHPDRNPRVRGTCRVHAGRRVTFSPDYASAFLPGEAYT